MRAHFVTLLGFAQFKLKRAQEAIRTLESGLELLDDHLKQGRLVIMGAAQKARGRSDAAETLLNELVQSREPEILAFRAAAVATSRFSWHIPEEIERDLILAAA